MYCDSTDETHPAGIQPVSRGLRASIEPLLKVNSYRKLFPINCYASLTACMHTY